MAIEPIARHRMSGSPTHGRSAWIAITVATMAGAATVLWAFGSAAVAEIAAVVFALGALAGLGLLLIPKAAARIPEHAVLPFAAVTAGVVVVTGLAFLAGAAGGEGPQATAGAASHGHEDDEHDADHDAAEHGDDHDEGHADTHEDGHDPHASGAGHDAGHDPGHGGAHDPAHGDGHDPGHGGDGGHDPGHGGGGGHDPGHDPGHGQPGGNGFPDHWTDAQVAFALKLIADTEAALAPWLTSPPTGMSWIGDGKNTGGYQHWINTGWWSTTLDPSKPGSLVYRNTGNGIRLEAAMYVLPFGYHMGNIPSDIAWLPGWHIHDNLCFSGTTLVGLTNAAGNCPAGGTRVITPPMLHVWIVDTPCGRFAGVDENGLQCNHDH